MKKNFSFLVCFLFIFSCFTCFICLTGCGKEPEAGEVILGGWTNERSTAYIYLKIKEEGKWDASVNITDFTSKIIGVKGNAAGNWHIEDNTLVLTVFESNISRVFKKGVTSFYEIKKLDDTVMELVDTHGQIITWKAVKPKGKGAGAIIINSIRMAPFTVNLNKTRSRDKDRYLCLNLKIILKEPLPGMESIKIHPKAREAVIVYLSSLIHKDIKDLGKVEAIQGTLRTILNPYVGNMVEEVDIDHVVVSTTIDRVQEFLIEHSIKARMSKKQDGDDNKE